MMLKNVFSSSYEASDSVGTSSCALAKVSVIPTDCPPVIATRPILRPLRSRPRATTRPRAKRRGAPPRLGHAALPNQHRHLLRGAPHALEEAASIAHPLD